MHMKGILAAMLIVIMHTNSRVDLWKAVTGHWMNFQKTTPTFFSLTLWEFLTWGLIFSGKTTPTILANRWKHVCLTKYCFQLKLRFKRCSSLG